MRNFFLLALLTIPLQSQACGMKIYWRPPTFYTDGVPLPLAAISRYELQCKHELVPGTIKKFPKARTRGYLLSSEDYTPGPYSCIMFTYALRGGILRVSEPSTPVTFLCQ